MTTETDAGRHTRQARLAGPSANLDPRVNAIRPELADARLAGVVSAARYAEGVDFECGAAAAMLRAVPDGIAVSELLPGERFVVFDTLDGWAWGQGVHDDYVGWVCASALTEPGPAATHRIVVPAAAVFEAPDIKARVMVTLPLNAVFAGAAADGGFVAAFGGYVHPRHVGAVDAAAADPVVLALGFVGTPYVWGGRTRDGIDCSGLTQAVLRAGGVAMPRDSDQQARFARAIAADDRARGDLVFFPGHVGILADREMLIHANAFAMTTGVEPLADVAARVAITSFGRPPAVLPKNIGARRSQPLVGP